MKKVKIGIVGTGGISGFVHLPGLKLLPNVEFVAACDTDEELLDNAVKTYGFKESYTDYKEMLEKAEVDAVINSTPNFMHAEVTIEAAIRGKHILCEKPIALNYAEAKKAVDAVKKARVKNMTAYTYLFLPAARYLKTIVDEGYIGKVREFRSAYIQQVPEIHLGWRSSKKLSGSGALGDIGSHLIMFAHHYVGKIMNLCSVMRTFFPKRKDRHTGKMKTADVDDAVAFIAEFKNGAIGTFEVSRCCIGQGARETEQIYIEIYGDKGSAILSLQEPMHLRVCLGEHLHNRGDVLTRVPVPRQLWKVPESPRNIPDFEPIIGFRYDQMFTFIDCIVNNKKIYPGLVEGMKVQKVLDAVISSHENKKWIVL